MKPSDRIEELTGLIVDGLEKRDEEAPNRSTMEFFATITGSTRESTRAARLRDPGVILSAIIVYLDEKALDEGLPE